MNKSPVVKRYLKIKMPNNKIKLIKVLIPSDLLIFLVIVAGIILSISVSEAAIRLIGLSIAILGIVALVMKISQRLAGIVEIKPKPVIPPPNFNITERKDKSAKRLIFEDFNKEEDASVPKEPERVKDFSKADEGFRIITKSSSAPKSATEESSIDTKSTKEDSVVLKVDDKVQPDKEIENNTDIETLIEEEIIDEDTTTDEIIELINIDLPEVIEKTHIEITENIPITDEQYEEPETVIYEEFIQPIKEKYAESEIPKEEIITEVTEFAEELEEEIKDDAEEKISENIENIIDSQVTQTIPEISTTVVIDDIKDSVPAIDIEKVESRFDIPPEAKASDIEPEQIPEMYSAKYFNEKPYFDKEQHYQETASQKEKHIEKDAYFKDIYDIPKNIFAEDIPDLEESKNEFRLFVNRVLSSIRSLTNCRTAGFFLVNSEMKQIYAEAIITDIPEAIAANTVFQLGSDVISQIIINQKPEILTEINPAAELDLIPYYDRQVGIQSFIGVPVFINKIVFGALCADTDFPDSFDSFTVGLFGHFTKLITAMTRIYTNMNDLWQDSKAFKAINHLKSITSKHNVTKSDIDESIVESVSTIFEFSTIGLVGYDNDNNGWFVKAIRTKKDIQSSFFDSYIDLEHSLAGQSIIFDKTIYLTQLESNYLRVHPDEPEMDGGFFVSVPLKASSGTFGAIYVEGDNSSSITPVDVSILQVVGEHAGICIEKMHLLEILQTSPIIDKSTGLLNSPAFYIRLQEEFVRGYEFNTPITLCLFQVDKYASLDPTKYRLKSERVLMNILNIARKLLKPYDVFGQLDSKTFGILFIGLDKDQAQTLAKKFRLEVASSMLDIDGEKFSATVSIGLADNQRIEDASRLLANAQRVLNISLDRANWVSVYS
ncbi:MAG: hypothetical protein QG635_1179 [Bacteroidota bacterium]|nr:hypothetical protein [Bacteroidota bacterium]